MHPCVFIYFSLLLQSLETTTANRLVAVGGGGDDNGVTKNCFVDERNALLDFKARLQDPNSCLSTWRAEEDHCGKWFGVTCNNQTGHVTWLDINFCGIGGEISHSLLNLSNLNYLDLSYNSFQGTIPTFIGYMTRLRYLNLGGCSFHGTIPTFIGPMTQLRCLYLSGNFLSGTIPGSVGSLTELVSLDLSDNSFHGIIPSKFGNLTNLQGLFLRHAGRCRVENPEWLSHLSHLQQLDMDGISLAKANHWVNVISSLPKLSLLSLEGCELSQVMHPCSSLCFIFNSSSSLSSLDLGDNDLNSSMYHWLFPLTGTKLRFLDLSYNMLDGIPKYLGNLCSLTALYLKNNSAVVQFPDFLKNLSGCTSLTLQQLYAPRSQFIGSLSDQVQKFSSLEELILSENQLNGTISGKLWELPMLSVIDLSKNSLEGVPSKHHMSNLSYVHVDLSSCNLGPRFPKWIQTLKNLTHLDLSNTRISDTIPVEFWDMCPSHLSYLNLSSNNISGMVPDLLSNFDNNSLIDLSFNNFHGPIPNVSSTVISLNLSRNKFNGGISFLCQMVDGFLEFLDLSHNFLTGQLPDCLRHFKRLTVLNLGHNSLSGRLPLSMGSLIELEALYLYKNNFSGELPLSLKNCTRLTSLNLGANNFSGNVPVWIGENLFWLYVLILRSNNFFGTIPLQLCQLPNLQILDLSVNNLHGTVPSCLNNLTSMVQEEFSQVQNVHHYYTMFTNSYSLDAAYVDHAMIEWQGGEREFTRNLGLLKSIDLSSNNLTGHIPYELTNLHELLALNLSKNALIGEIPQQVGQMKNLVALDLSRNKLSGVIPSSMSQMNFLGYLDVSCNNLSGRIPLSTQLQSFQPSSYDGNARLCGPPLSRKCPGDEESQVGKSKGDGEDMDEFWGWFCIGGGTGFVTGFWIACGALLLNRRGRRAFFHFYDNFRDWVYVKVVVFIAKLRRIAHK